MKDTDDAQEEKIETGLNRESFFCCCFLSYNKYKEILMLAYGKFQGNNTWCSYGCDGSGTLNVIPKSKTEYCI